MRVVAALCLLAVAVGAHSQPPTPSPGKVSEPQKQRASEDQRNPDNATDKRAAPAISVSVSPVINHHPENQRGYRHEESSTDWWKPISDILLVVFTGVLAWATIRLMGATKNNAKAAADLARNAVYAEAPYILAVVTQSVTDIQPAKYAFVNEGKTPGVVTKFQDVCRYLVGALPTNPDALFRDSWGDREIIYSPIGPSHVSRPIKEIVTCELHPADMPAAAARTQGGHFYLIGRYNYSDLFGGKREARFCFRFVERGHMTREGGTAYNYDRPIEQ